MTTKNVLITGANRGIGLGLCEHYLNAGWQVIAACRNSQNLPAQLQASKSVHALEIDLSCEGSIKAFAKEVEALALPLDLLINNAGVTAHEEFGEWTQAAFMDTLRVNSVAPAMLAQALSPRLAQASTLVQLSSGLASIKGAKSNIDPFCSYSMSKAALNMSTMKLAAILRQRNICVVSMSPGWVQTDMGGAEAPDTIPEAVKKMADSIAALSIQDSGRFMNELGETIAW